MAIIAIQNVTYGGLLLTKVTVWLMPKDTRLEQQIKTKPDTDGVDVTGPGKAFFCRAIPKPCAVRELLVCAEKKKEIN